MAREEEKRRSNNTCHVAGLSKKTLLILVAIVSAALAATAYAAYLVSELVLTVGTVNVTWSNASSPVYDIALVVKASVYDPYRLAYPLMLSYKVSVSGGPTYVFSPGVRIIYVYRNVTKIVTVEKPVILPGNITIKMLMPCDVYVNGTKVCEDAMICNITFTEPGTYNLTIACGPVVVTRTITVKPADLIVHIGDVEGKDVLAVFDLAVDGTAFRTSAYARVSVYEPRTVKLSVRLYGIEVGYAEVNVSEPETYRVDIRSTTLFVNKTWSGLPKLFVWNRTLAVSIYTPDNFRTTYINVSGSGNFCIAINYYTFVQPAVRIEANKTVKAWFETDPVLGTYVLKICGSLSTVSLTIYDEEVEKTEVQVVERVVEKYRYAVRTVTVEKTRTRVITQTRVVEEIPGWIWYTVGVLACLIVLLSIVVILKSIGARPGRARAVLVR